MIICIDYSLCGNRNISKIIYDDKISDKDEVEIAYNQTKDYKEVYLVSFESADRELITHILTQGSRVYRNN